MYSLIRQDQFIHCLMDQKSPENILNSYFLFGIDYSVEN